MADDGEDSELDEDNLLETPLDKLEPYIVFRDSLLSKFEVLDLVPRFSITQGAVADIVAGLQQEQGSLYESLTKVLDASEQQVLQGVIHEAEARTVATQQAMAQLEANMTAGAPNNSASQLPGS